MGPWITPDRTIRIRGSINIRLPLSLAGKGTTSVVLNVDGIATKPVQVTLE
jgi:hypothetical protein